jgi:thiosulfate dehydrogenase [quinone] large subunit
MIGLTQGDGTADASGNLRAADWFYRSKAASVLWLVARLWLGYGWLSAGYQKLWGSEKAAFWNGGGAGVKGFATAGVAGSAAAFAGLTLNLVYMFTGSAGVNPAYAIVSVFLILAWRNAGYLGLDGFALPMARAGLRRKRPVTGLTAPPLPAEEPVS